jgi:hypothetical protein
MDSNHALRSISMGWPSPLKSLDDKGHGAMRSHAETAAWWQSDADAVRRPQDPRTGFENRFLPMGRLVIGHFVADLSDHSAQKQAINCRNLCDWFVQSFAGVR